MISEFDEILNEVNTGMSGKNSFISMGYKKLDKYIGIRKKVQTLVFGASGSGKSSFVHEAFILNPFDWLQQNDSELKIQPILFLMERSKIFTKVKWLSRKIFLDRGIIIPVGKMLGWWRDDRLTKDEHDLILMYRDYIDALMEYCIIVPGANNPTGFYKYMKAYAEKNGKVEEIDEFHRVYIPNDENKIVIPILDHIGLTKLERDYKTKKEAIDKLSEYAQIWRDLYHYSPVLVAQINRDLGNVAYQKLGDFEPTIDQIKESSNPAESSDTILSLFDPIRYSTQDKGGYEASKFINPKDGSKNFRSIKILKSTYSIDGVRAGTCFQGAVGCFKTLPPKDQITESIYEEIFNNRYYLKQ